MMCPVFELYRFDHPGEDVYVGTYGGPKSAWGKARKEVARRGGLPLCMYSVRRVPRGERGAA